MKKKTEIIIIVSGKQNAKWGAHDVNNMDVSQHFVM